MTQIRNHIAEVYLRGRVVGHAVVWREDPPEVTLCVSEQARLDAGLDSLLGGRGLELQIPSRIESVEIHVTIGGSEAPT